MSHVREVLQATSEKIYVETNPTCAEDLIVAALIEIKVESPIIGALLIRLMDLSCSGSDDDPLTPEEFRSAVLVWLDEMIELFKEHICD